MDNESRFLGPIPKKVWDDVAQVSERVKEKYGAWIMYGAAYALTPNGWVVTIGGKELDL